MQQRAERSQRRWTAVAAVAEKAVAEGRWAPPRRLQARPLSDLESAIQDTHRLTEELQVRSSLRSLLRSGGSDSAGAPSDSCSPRSSPPQVLESMQRHQQRQLQRGRSSRREASPEPPPPPSPPPPTPPDSARVHAADLNLQSSARSVAPYRTAWGPDAHASPPGDSSAHPVWRPSGQGSSGQGASQRRLPGWAVKERRLRAKLAGPGDADEEAPPADAVLRPFGGGDGLGTSPPLVWQDELGYARPDAAGAPGPGTQATEPWDALARPRGQPLRLVVPRATSRLFDDSGDERLLSPHPPPSARPSPSPWPPQSLAGGGARTPISVLRVASRRMIQPTGSRTPTLTPLAAAAASHPSPPPVDGRGSATLPYQSGPVHFMFDSPPKRLQHHDAGAPATRSHRVASDSTRYIPLGARTPAMTPTAKTTPTGHSHSPSPSNAGGVGHREWSPGLAWLYDESSAVEEGAAPVPWHVVAPSQQLHQEAVVRTASFRGHDVPSSSSRPQLFETTSRRGSRGDSGGAAPAAAHHHVRVHPRRPHASSSVAPQAPPKVIALTSPLLIRSLSQLPPLASTFVARVSRGLPAIPPPHSRRVFRR